MATSTIGAASQIPTFNNMKQSLDNQFSQDWENWLSPDINKSWKAIQKSAGPSAGNMVIYPGTQQKFAENASDNLGFFRNMFVITEEVSAGTNSNSATSSSALDENKEDSKTNSFSNSNSFNPLIDEGVGGRNPAFAFGHSASVDEDSLRPKAPLNPSDSSIPVSNQPTVSATPALVTNKNERNPSRKCVVPFFLVAVAVATLAHFYLKSQVSPQL